MLPIRLQKFLSDAGLMSRRAAEEEIKRGNVTVNGHVAELGMKVNPKLDAVAYKGKRVRYILNKFNENKDAELVAKLENIINKQIFLRIPLNYMATNASLSHGKTLKEITPKLDVVEKYTKLGGFIATRE